MKLIVPIVTMAIGSGLTACSGSSAGGPSAARSTTGAAQPDRTTAVAATTVAAGTPSFTDPLTPSSSVPAGKLAPVPLLTGSVGDGIGVSWRLERYQAETGQLVLSWRPQEKGCLTTRGIRVLETATTVTVAAIAWAPPNVRINCDADPVDTGYLDLSQPLGDRKLIHASTDEG